MRSFQTSEAPELVTKITLRAITVPTKKTIREALPCFSIALRATWNPSSDPIKQMLASMAAAAVFSTPSNMYWSDDIVDEKKTMKEQVAAVTYGTHGMGLIEGC